MCPQYWTAWEKYLSKREAGSRLQLDKAINASKDHWRAWEKYLLPKPAERVLPPKVATSPLILGWYAWERYTPAYNEVSSRKQIDVPSSEPISSPSSA